MNAPPSPIDASKLDVSRGGDPTLVRVLGWMLALTLFAFVLLGLYTAVRVGGMGDGCIACPPCACGGVGCPACMPMPPGNAAQSSLEQMVAYGQTLEKAQHALDGGKVEEAFQILQAQPAEVAGWEHHYLVRRCERLALDLVLAGVGPTYRTADGTLQVTRAGPGRWAVVESNGQACWNLELVQHGPYGGMANEPLESGLFSCWKYGRDGSRLVRVAGNRFTVWDVKTGRTFLDAQTHEGDIKAVAFSRDGSRVFTIVEEDECDHFRGWEVEPADRVLKAEVKGVRPLGLTFEADGKTLTMLGEDGKVRRWHAGSGQRLPDVTLAGFDAKAGRAILHANGGLAAAVGKDGAVRLWDARSGKITLTLPAERPHRHGDLAISPDGRLIACAWGTHVRIWSLSGEETRRSGVVELTAVQFSADNERIAARGPDSDIHEWPSAGQPWKDAQDGIEGRVRLFTKNGISAHLLAKVGRHAAEIWRDEDAQVTQKGVYRTPEQMLSGTVSPDSQRLIAACAGGRLVIWDIGTSFQVASFVVPIKEPCRLAFSRDQKCLAVAGSDGTIRLLDGADRKKQRE